MNVNVNVNVKVNGGVKIMRPVGSTVPVDRWSVDNRTSYNRAMGTIAPTKRATDMLMRGIVR